MRNGFYLGGFFGVLLYSFLGWAHFDCDLHLGNLVLGTTDRISLLRELFQFHPRSETQTYKTPFWLRRLGELSLIRLYENPKRGHLRGLVDEALGEIGEEYRIPSHVNLVALKDQLVSWLESHRSSTFWERVDRYRRAREAHALTQNEALFFTYQDDFAQFDFEQVLRLREKTRQMGLGPMESLLMIYQLGEETVDRLLEFQKKVPSKGVLFNGAASEAEIRSRLPGSSELEINLWRSLLKYADHHAKREMISFHRALNECAHKFLFMISAYCLDAYAFTQAMDLNAWNASLVLPGETPFRFVGRADELKDWEIPAVHDISNRGYRFIALGDLALRRILWIGGDAKGDLVSDFFSFHTEEKRYLLTESKFGHTTDKSIRHAVEQLENSLNGLLGRVPLEQVDLEIGVSKRLPFPFRKNARGELEKGERDGNYKLVLVRGKSILIRDLSQVASLPLK